MRGLLRRGGVWGREGVLISDAKESRVALLNFK